MDVRPQQVAPIALCRSVDVARADWRNGDSCRGGADRSANGRRYTHELIPWVYLRHALTELPSRPAGADPIELLPDVWRRSGGAPSPAVGS